MKTNSIAKKPKTYKEYEEFMKIKIDSLLSKKAPLLNIVDDIDNIISKSFKNIDAETQFKLSISSMKYLDSKFKSIRGEFPVIKLYKYNRKIIGFIRKTTHGFEFCTGKPSDREGLTWQYTKLTDAIKTGNEYYNNHVKLMSSSLKAF